MLITKEFILEIGKGKDIMYYPEDCRWFIANFPDGGEHEDVFRKAIEDNHFEYPTWQLACHMTQTQATTWAIYCARSVLHIFEAKYLDDIRPRQLIETTEHYLAKPCKKRRLMVWKIILKAVLGKQLVGWRSAQTALSAFKSAVWTARVAEDAEDVVWSLTMAAHWAAKADPSIVLDLLCEGFRIWKDT